ncbi:MAG: hypothetical protein RIF41_09020, partial [Polyangiaceae bacterium]
MRVSLLVLVVLSTIACRDEQACLSLRQQGFEILNGAHPCNDDSDCRTSEWPDCGKPLNHKTDAKLTAVRERAEAAECEDVEASCERMRPAYCDRNLCVARPVPV